MVNQVPVVGILMIVNGSLMCLVGLALTIFGPVFYAMITNAPKQHNGMGPGDEEILTIFSIVYSAIGVLVLISAILNLVAGIRALKYRGRTFAIVALFSNLVQCIVCYCSLTSLGLLIYGLIVMFQTDVGKAFALGDQGVSPDEIKERFGPRRYRRDRDYDDDYDEDRRDRRDRSPPSEKPDAPPDEGFTSNGPRER